MSEAASRLETIVGTVRELRKRGLVHRTAEDSRFDGRTLTLDGERLVNFAHCSYLGLELDARLKRGACEAVDRYGVQFSSSRAYVSAPLYAVYEALLSRMVGDLPVVVAQTTSLAHLAALPVLLGSRDAVLFDLQVHNSVRAVLPTLNAMGVRCEPVPHRHLGRMAVRAAALAREHEHVFYLCDGVYSMHGDATPIDELFEILDGEPRLFAYVDDAHGVGWAGRHGAGVALGHRRIHPRMIVALSLAKGFAAAGGALVFPNEELSQRVFTCGSTLIFSGPLQPAQLGAGIASANICLSPEITELQRRLRERIELFDELTFEHGVGAKVTEPTPIRFVELGSENACLEAAVALKQAGYYVNAAVFPAVPRKRAGLRITLTCHQTLDDVAGLVGELARVAPPRSESGASAEPTRTR